MNLSKVLENFLLISGVDQNKSIVYMPILKSAVRKLTSKLKNKTTKEEDEPRLNHAAAALAFYDYILCMKSKNSVASFSTGEINIKTNLDSSLNAAKDIWLSEKEGIIDLLKDDTFAFSGIPTYKYIH